MLEYWGEFSKNFVLVTCFAHMGRHSYPEAPLYLLSPPGGCKCPMLMCAYDNVMFIEIPRYCVCCFRDITMSCTHCIGEWFSDVTDWSCRTTLHYYHIVLFYLQQAGENVESVRWQRISSKQALYAAHLMILQKVAALHKAAFWGNGCHHSGSQRLMYCLSVPLSLSLSFRYIANCLVHPCAPVGWMHTYSAVQCTVSSDYDYYTPQKLLLREHSIRCCEDGLTSREVALKCSLDSVSFIGGRCALVQYYCSGMICHEGVVSE